MPKTADGIPGFNVEKMEEFNEHAAQHPNEVLLGLEAKTLWEGQGLDNLAKVGPWNLADDRIDKPTRDFSIQFGAWQEVEQEIGIENARDRLEPVEAALASMCSCVNSAICINAAREGLSFDELEVTAQAQVDPRVLLGVVPVEEAASCLQSVDLSIDVRGEDLTEEDRARIEEMAKRSPVHSLVSHANTVRTDVAVQ